MVIKLTVSQTSGSFSSMRVGGGFYYWLAFLMNIINDVHTQIQHLQENEYKVAHTQDSTKKNIPTSFCQGVWRRQLNFKPFCVDRADRLHRPPSVHLFPLLPSSSARHDPLSGSSVGGPTVNEQRYLRSIHTTIIIVTTIRVWLRFNQLYDCLIAGPVRCHH